MVAVNIALAYAYGFNTLGKFVNILAWFFVHITIVLFMPQTPKGALKNCQSGSDFGAGNTK
jgi:hypothetical protein